MEELDKLLDKCFDKLLDKGFDKRLDKCFEKLQNVLENLLLKNKNNTKKKLLKNKKVQKNVKKKQIKKKNCKRRKPKFQMFGKFSNTITKNYHTIFESIIKLIIKTKSQFINGNFGNFTNWLPVDIIKLM